MFDDLFLRVGYSELQMITTDENLLHLSCTRGGGYVYVIMILDTSGTSSKLIDEFLQIM